MTGYHPNYFLLGFRATPSIPTSKRSSSCSFQEKDGPAAGRFAGASRLGGQGPPGTSRGRQRCEELRPRKRLYSFASKRLQDVQGPGPPGASRGLQELPALSGQILPPDPFPKLSGQILGGFPAPGPPPRGLQELPPPNRLYQPFQGQILGGSQVAPLPQGPHPQICCS